MEKLIVFLFLSVAYGLPAGFHFISEIQDETQIPALKAELENFIRLYTDVAENVDVDEHSENIKFDDSFTFPEETYQSKEELEPITKNGETYDEDTNVSLGDETEHLNPEFFDTSALHDIFFGPFENVQTETKQRETVYPDLDFSQHFQPSSKGSRTLTYRANMFEVPIGEEFDKKLNAALTASGTNI